MPMISRQGISGCAERNVSEIIEAASPIVSERFKRRQLVNPAALELLRVKLHHDALRIAAERAYPEDRLHRAA